MGNMQNFMDLADYSEKYEAKVDMINDYREAQGMLKGEKQKKMLTSGKENTNEAK